MLLQLSKLAEFVKIFVSPLYAYKKAALAERSVDKSGDKMAHPLDINHSFNCFCHYLAGS